MHADGARIFVEVGPGATLTGWSARSWATGRTWRWRASPQGDAACRASCMTLGRLLVAGVPLRLDRLTAGRARAGSTRPGSRPNPTPSRSPPPTWLVNGSRARPASGPEPARLGVGPALPAPGSAVSRNGKAHAPHQNGTVLPEFAVRPLTSAVSGPSDGVERAFVEFQKTMQAFLEVQRTTMLALLSGEPAHPPCRPLPSTVEAEPDLLRRVPTATPARVEPVPPKPVSAPERLGREGLAARLLAIVRERTGYPAEMLRLDLDLEADLGIDSIKRVEILGSLREALPSSAFGSDSEMMDQLSRARTLGAIVERLARTLDVTRPREAATGPSRPPAPARGQAHEPDARRAPAHARGGRRPAAPSSPRDGIDGGGTGPGDRRPRGCRACRGCRPSRQGACRDPGRARVGPPGRAGGGGRRRRPDLAGRGGRAARPRPGTRPAGGDRACAAAPGDAAGRSRSGGLVVAAGPGGPGAVPAGAGLRGRPGPRGRSRRRLPDRGDRDGRRLRHRRPGARRLLPRPWRRRRPGQDARPRVAPPVRVRVVDLDPRLDVELLAADLVQEVRPAMAARRSATSIADG